MTSSQRSFAAIIVIVTLLAAASFRGFFREQIETESVSPPAIPAEAQPAISALLPAYEYPVEELRSALTDACSEQSSENAVNEWTPEQIQSQTKKYDDTRQNLSARLSVSHSADHLHAAALLEDDPATRVELIARAISRSPSDPFLVWSAVQICYESSDSVDCRSRNWDQRLIAIDGQNSESWVRVAANRYAAGDSVAALEAMRRASTAAESRIYWTETIELIERGLAAAGSDDPFPERASMALGFAAMMLPRFNEFTTMCREQSLRSSDWAYVCLQYGELAEIQGKTEIGVAIGRSIQKIALEAMGELDGAAEVEQRLQASRQQRMDAIKTQNPESERLIFSNPTLFSAFLAGIRSHGEATARRQILAEIERLIEQEPELACEFS